jgi:hypothetical protein
MKRAVFVLLIFVLMTGLLTSDAWAGAQVYITVGIGGGVLIGFVGVFIQVAFHQRIAQQHQRHEEQTVDYRRSVPNLNIEGQTGLKTADSDRHFEPFKKINEAKREVHPDLEVNLFTFRW